jgi:hypothetical protein
MYCTVMVVYCNVIVAAHHCSGGNGMSIFTIYRIFFWVSNYMGYAASGVSSFSTHEIA